jgi:Fur family ferric uptake transcriptional regulator
MDESKRRNTRQKDAVRHALGEAIGFVSAQQLHLVLRNFGSTIGLATVYRALADLAASGDADALQSKDGELLYRADKLGVGVVHFLARSDHIR